MIDTSMWKRFKVSDIFVTEKHGSGLQVPTGAMMSKKELEDGDIPRVTVSNFNNGITGYYADSDDKNYRTYKNFISVSFLGTIFYQPDKVSLDMKVHCLKPSDYDLNVYSAGYMVSVIRKAISNFAYSDQLSSTVLADLEFALPATSDGQPDWVYMESYMKQIMEESEKSLENLIDVSGWGEFRVGDLLHMEKQIELNPVDAYNNNMENEITYPFYGQSSENNGIIDYYYLGEDLLNNQAAKFCIMIHSNTHLAYCINTPFYLKDGHSATTIFTNEHFNEMTTYFLISVLNTTMDGNFDYNMKATKEKLNDLIIKLPITSAGEPDWQYMEDYMRAIMDKSEQIISDLQIGA